MKYKLSKRKFKKLKRLKQLASRGRNKSGAPLKYKEYIKSMFWRKRRNRFFAEFGRICFICKIKSHIVLHHLEYKNNLFGVEPDESLVCLCNGCHEEFHAIYGVKQKMYDEFNEFIQMKYDEKLWFL